MSDYLYLTTLAVMFGTVLAVFGMRYYSLMNQARSRATAETEYRELATKGVSFQAESATALTVMKSELSQVNARLASIEKILKAVE